MNNHKYFFFYSGVFSQWYKCEFYYEGVTFNCAEQYMMYSKAILFNDIEASQKILSYKTPRSQKQAGRKVKNFDERIWSHFREGIVFQANYLKFSQNCILKEQLLETGNLLLVEASPKDNIWGIGLSEKSLDRFDERKWNGLNLLGKALTKVKFVLQYEASV